MDTFLTVLSCALGLIASVAIEGLIMKPSMRKKLSAKHNSIVVFFIWPFVLMFENAKIINQAMNRG